MKLSNSYNGLTEKDIMNMTEQEMRNILLNLVNLETVETNTYNSTDMFLPDEVADVLRGRYI